MNVIKKFRDWSGSNTAVAKCTRTIFHGVVSAFITYIPDLVTGTTVIPTEFKALAVACFMAVLSPIQAQLGVKEESR